MASVAACGDDGTAHIHLPTRVYRVYRVYRARTVWVPE